MLRLDWNVLSSMPRTWRLSSSQGKMRRLLKFCIRAGETAQCVAISTSY